MHEEMARDEKVFFIGEDLDVDGGVWNEAVGLLEKFGPNRVVGTPIAEAGFTGLAVGAALADELRPVVEFMYGDFVQVPGSSVDGYKTPGCKLTAAGHCCYRPSREGYAP